MSDAQLVETARLVEAMTAKQPTGRRMRIQLISPGWGSSGYYSETVLKQAAADRVFAAGTSMYIDHQTFSEANDRVHGERSLKDLAGKFATDAEWDGHALVANVEAFGTWRPVLADMAEHVGVSIRSYGRGEQGQAEGRNGLIVSSIDKAQSVDFVAEAGRGGKVLQLLEAARVEIAEARNVGAWLESRLHLAFTEMADEMYGDGRLTREERITLSSGIGDGLAAFTGRVEADAPHLYTRDLYDGPPEQIAAMAETAGPTEPPAPGAPPESADAPAPDGDPPAPPPTDPPPAAPEQTTTAPPPTDPSPEPQADAAAPAPLEESKEDPMTTPTGAAETASPPPAPPALPTARSLIEAELTNERRATAMLRARDEARPILAEALADGWIPPATQRRITETLMRDLPLTEANTLDKAELIKVASQELAQAEHEIAEALTAAGVGRPRDLGFTEASVGGLGTTELDGRLENAFAGLGLNESTAKLAAKGRG